MTPNDPHSAKPASDSTPEAISGAVPERIAQSDGSVPSPADPSPGVLGTAEDEGPQTLPDDAPQFIPLEHSPIMMEGFVPLFLTATRAMAEGNPEAEKLGAATIELLKRNAAASNESEDGLWTAAAMVSRAVFIEHRPALAMVDLAKELDKHEGYAWKTLCTMTYLGGSVDIKTIPRLAVSLHMAVAEYVCRGTIHMPDVYANVVAPWFGAYWWRVFDNARFRFSMPKLVELDLRDALASPLEVTVQRVLRAAALGLAVPLPERGREWFEVAKFWTPDEAPSGDEDATGAKSR